MTHNIKDDIVAVDRWYYDKDLWSMVMATQYIRSWREFSTTSIAYIAKLLTSRSEQEGIILGD